MPHLEMLPKLKLLRGIDAAQLGEPPPQAQDSCIDIVLQSDRVVKRNLCCKGIFCLLRQFRRFYQPLERAARRVAGLDLLGTDPGFAGEFLGGHEEWARGPAGDSQRTGGLLLGLLKAVEADMPAGHGAVFLPGKAVVVFPLAAMSGKQDAVISAPDPRGIADEFRAIAAVKLQNRQGDWGFDAGQSLERPLVGVAGEGAQLYPAQSDIGGGHQKPGFSRSSGV